MKVLKMFGGIIVAALTAMSCKKQADLQLSQSPASADGKNFSEITYLSTDASSEVFTYKYDKAGKLTTVSNVDYTDAFDYISTSKLVVTRKNSSDNSILRVYEADLNTDGAAVLLVGKDKNGAVVETTSLTYNGEGYLVKHSTQGPASSYAKEYVVENGKLKSAKKFNNGVQNGTITYALDETKENKQCLTTWGYWSARGLFGKRLKFLVSEYTEYNSAGAVTWHWNATYDRDADGNVTQQHTDYFSDGKGSTVYKY